MVLAAGDGRRQAASARYIGPDNEATRRRLEALEGEAAALRARRDMVRSLRAARLPYSDALTGDVLAAMSEAGVFRLRAVVIGSVAFQCYAAMLGERLPATLSRTSDVDVPSFTRWRSPWRMPSAITWKRSSAAD